VRKESTRDSSTLKDRAAALGANVSTACSIENPKSSASVCGSSPLYT